MKTLRHYFLLAAIALAGATAANAQYSYNYDLGRGRSTEFYFLAGASFFDKADFGSVTIGSPVSATHDLGFKLEDTFTWGVGVAYNFNAHFAVRAEFTFSNPNFTLTWGDNRLKGDAWLQAGKLNFEYNILKGSFSPFVSAGVGYLYMDTNIPTGPAGYVVWWDWWGPVVVGYQPTYSNTYFTYNVAAGVRYDFARDWTVRFAATANWIHFGDGAGDVPSLEAVLNIGWRY